MYSKKLARLVPEVIELPFVGPVAVGGDDCRLVIVGCALNNAAAHKPIAVNKHTLNRRLRAFTLFLL